MADLVSNPDAWSAIAETYDAAARELLTPFSEEAVRWAALDGSDDVLDVACGPGTTTVLAARRARSVVALDFSAAMIGQLEKNIADLDNVSFGVGDGQALSFEDATYSAAFSMFGLMFFPDPVAGLRELHRVLRPGGRVLIGSWVPRDASPMMKPLAEAMQAALPPDPDALPPTPFPFQTPEQLGEGLRAGGFVDVEVRTVTPIVSIDGPDDYWARMGGSLFVTHLRNTLEDAWDPIETKIREHLEDRLAGVESLPMPGLIGRGRKA